MSRVTVQAVYNSVTASSAREYEQLRKIEVVPRKIVEMIIEECERNEITNYKYGNYCAGDNLKHIREYAESLLEQFEEDTE